MLIQEWLWQLKYGTFLIGLSFNQHTGFSKKFMKPWFYCHVINIWPFDVDVGNKNGWLNVMQGKSLATGLVSIPPVLI